MDFFDILLAKKLKNDKDVSIVQLNVSENGTYSESGKAYSPVVVDVQPPSNSYLRTQIDSYPTTAEQLPIPKCDVEIANQKSCKVFVSNKPFVNDKVPYLFRKSAGGDRVYEKLIGGTIAWNQGVKNGNFADTSNWASVSSTKAVSNNEMTVTAVNQTSGQGIFSETTASTSWGVGHKVLATFDVKTNATNAKIRGTLAYNTATKNRFLESDTLITATWQRLSGIVNISEATSGIRIVVVDPSTVQVGETVTFRNVMAFDLTQMFGSTIADYIYSLEQATAGAGVAWFRTLFPNDYYAYDSGSLQSVNVASKKVYDSNNTLVATYTFDSDVTLRGLPKLDSNNNLYYDGDTYSSDGTVTRRYGIVDLGTLEWTKASNATRFYVAYNGIKVISDNTPANILCTKYITDSWNSVLTPKDKEIGASVGNYITIYDSSYNDAQAFKTAMSGVYLVYELATPTTESADTYINPQIVDADGTEEFVDYAYSQSTRDVAVPVGHDSLYYNGQLYQTDFAQATTDTINMAELHSIVPPNGEFYITSNGTLSVDVWKK